MTDSIPQDPGNPSPRSTAGLPTGLFKIQWPIAGTGMCLAYDESRAQEFLIPKEFLPKGLRRILREELMIYVMAYVDSEGMFIIDEVKGGFDYGLECGW